MDATLARLDAARKALRHHRLATPEAFTAAPPDVRRSIAGAERIERAIRDGERAVLRLLFWDAEAEAVEWEVASFGADGSRRGLILTYGPAGEQRILAALRALADGARR